MLYAIKKTTQERIAANTAVKAKDNKYNFCCPACGADMLLKNGTINAAHFAHVKGSICDEWYDVSNVMSDWHRIWQEQFPEESREKIITNYWNGEKETHIADVCINNYVIEFQHSPMGPEEFMKRTKFYYHCGYKVIWVFDFNDIINNNNLYEYDNCKWVWKYPKKTFINFNPNFSYWKKRVGLFMDYGDEPDRWIERISWCINEYDDRIGTYINNYSRICTSEKHRYDTQEEFVNLIKNKQLDLNKNTL